MGIVCAKPSHHVTVEPKYAKGLSHLRRTLARLPFYISCFASRVPLGMDLASQILDAASQDAAVANQEVLPAEAPDLLQLFAGDAAVASSLCGASDGSVLLPSFR